MTPMSIERILPGVAALEGLIYVVGGEQESKILANGEVTDIFFGTLVARYNICIQPPTWLHVSNALQVYNPQEDFWTPIETMIIPRCAFGLTAFENYMFAFGGWVGEDIGGSIERYDPYSNECE
jgi:actin-binding protein IPP